MTVFKYDFVFNYATTFVATIYAQDVKFARDFKIHFYDFGETFK